MSEQNVIIEPSSNHQFSVIWLHGLGANADDFVPIVPQLNIDKATNTRFIFPNAPVRPVSLNAGMPMRAWFDVTALDESAEIDVEGVLQSQQTINELINTEIANGINSNSIILAGFSQGAALAMVTGLSYDKPLGGLIALSGFMPHHGFSQLDLHDTNKSLKIFMGHGTHDGIVPFKVGEQTKERLRSHGYDIQWHEYEMDHSVCPQEINDISSFLDKLGM